MTDSPILISFASWEDRFRDGFPFLLEEYSPQKVLMFFLSSYSEMTKENRQKVAHFCKVVQIEVRDHELTAEDLPGNWKMLRETLFEEIPQQSVVLVDFSTMPREIIWTVFWLLELREATIAYVYQRPRSYGDWLSRDPQRPRLVYKMSGLSSFGLRTLLVVLAGYDVERTKQLVEFFEPEVTLLGLQEQDLDEANSERMNRHIERFQSDPTVKLFSVNAFGRDHGQAAVETEIKPYLKSHNIIMSSLGPKLSAVSLYRIQKMYPQIGLAYAPSKEFNQAYSTGLGGAIKGIV